MDKSLLLGDLHSFYSSIYQDLLDNCFPTIIQSWNNNNIKLTNPGTHFGFIYQGHPILSRFLGTESYTLHPGMYFSLPQEGCINGQNSSGIVITLLNYQGIFMIGGALESQGKFAYINNCTNNLLIPPIKRGDPCLNALYIPPQVDQTAHTHPSYRLGIIVEGSGILETSQGREKMTPGIVFYLPNRQLHKFQTTAEKLTLVVFHPDSDAGFTHQDNPMLKRTLVDGVSVSQLSHLITNLS